LNQCTCARGPGVFVLESRKLRLGSVPDFEPVFVRANKLLEMCRECPPIDLGALTWWSNALGDVEDDAGEAIAVDPNFLVIRYLSKLAIEDPELAHFPNSIS
jgi:hypothetical protein